MFAFPTNMVEILKYKKPVGIDGVSAEVLEISLPVTLFILIDYLNPFLSRGRFPKCLNDAIVYPLLKSGDIFNINNYRSISILSAISKVFWKNMYERLYSFFDKKNTFYLKQFSFRKKRSINDALAEVIEQIRQGSTDRYTGMLLQLHKAIDSINLEILFAELRKYGVGGICLKWFEST